MAAVIGEHPVDMQCPQCKAQIRTAVTYECGCMAIICLLIGLFTGFFPGLCIACSDCVKDVAHSCPSCHACIGTYKRC